MPNMSAFQSPSLYYGQDYQHLLKTIINHSSPADVPELINTPIHHGMALLHIAVGTNDYDLTKQLIDLGARFFPDDQGRMPSLMAILCEADDRICDLVDDAEAKALGIDTSAS
jgi:ankyrin repeat protein